MKNLFKMMMTGADGVTFDPARVIGYGTVIAGVAVFLFDSVWSVLQTHAFDPQAYGLGFTGVCGGIMAVGIGVGAKAHAEPKP